MCFRSELSCQSSSSMSELLKLRGGYSNFKGMAEGGGAKLLFNTECLA